MASTSSGFLAWHKARLGHLPWLLRGALWFLYGFIWIPIWYWRSKDKSTPLSKTAASIVMVLIFGLGGVGGMIQERWKAEQDWRLIQQVSGVTALQWNLERYLTHTTFKDHIDEARSALQQLKLLERAKNSLINGSRAMVDDRNIRRTPCVEKAKSPSDCPTVPPGRGIEVFNFSTVGFLEGDIETLSALPRAIELVAKPDYLVVINQTEERVGTYTNGGSGYRVKWVIYILDVRTREITAETTLTGDDPPGSIRSSFGSSFGATGAAPRAEFKAWLRNVQAQSPNRESAQGAAKD